MKSNTHRRAFAKLTGLALLCLIPLFQNCGGFNPKTELSEASSTSGASKQIVLTSTIGSRVLQVGSADSLVVGETYSVSTATLGSHLVFDVSPQGACTVAASLASFACTKSALVVIQLVQQDSLGVTTIIDEEGFSVIDEASLAGRGAALYDGQCVACHGALPVSAKRNRTVAEISDSIVAQPSMSSVPELLELSSVELHALKVALSSSAGVPAPNPTATPAPAATATPAPTATPTPKPTATPAPLPTATPRSTPTPAPTATPLDGFDLHAINCAGCHGAYPNSAHKGASAATITNAIKTISQMKTKTLMALTPTEIQAIANAIK